MTHLFELKKYFSEFSVRHYLGIERALKVDIEIISALLIFGGLALAGYSLYKLFRNNANGTEGFVELFAWSLHKNEIIPTMLIRKIWKALLPFLLRKER